MLNVTLGQFLKRLDPMATVHVMLIDAASMGRIGRGYLPTAQDFTAWEGTAAGALYSFELSALMNRQLAWVSVESYEPEYEWSWMSPVETVVVIHVPLTEEESRDELCGR